VQSKCWGPAASATIQIFTRHLLFPATISKLFRPDIRWLPTTIRADLEYHWRASSIVPLALQYGGLACSMAARREKHPHSARGRGGAADYDLRSGAFVCAREPACDRAITKRASTCSACGLVMHWSRAYIQAGVSTAGPFLAKTLRRRVAVLYALMRWSHFARPGISAVRRPRAAGVISPATMQRRGGFASNRGVAETRGMLRRASRPFLLSAASAASCTGAGQGVAHPTSNGCNLQTGDLLAPGTVSAQRPRAMPAGDHGARFTAGVLR